jgi:carboxypeptidase Taq
MNQNYTRYTELLRKVADIQNAAALLNWDQETYMPPKGAGFRAQQLSTLAGIAHELATSKELGDLLEVLSNDKTLSDREQKNIQKSLKSYTDNKKYTTEFVQELSRTISETFQAWQSAKEKNDFSIYAPHLEKLVALKRKECEILGYKAHPYDALLDQYEPDSKTADLEVLFADVRSQLVAFVKQIAAKPQNDDAFMYLKYDNQKQWDLGLEYLKQMGYDFEAGRQDRSSHPFTTNFSCQDVRVTTRVNENDLNEMLWSTIHEGGHALYEQGLPVSEYGLPLGEYISLGIHESQSRMWENNVGRSLGYWKGNFDRMQQTFPEQLKGKTAQDFYKAMNIVKPSLIRTSADELTYHFHVLIRFEIEKALIENKIQVKDLPSYWNAKYKEYLGIDVPSDSKGVLQDIHWSHGSFGYFPTYSLGSFYAAQFFAQAKKENPELEKQIEAGNMKPLLEWLREKVHKHGKYYTAEELCIAITGEKLNFQYFMDYAKKKYSQLYSL